MREHVVICRAKRKKDRWLRCRGWVASVAWDDYEVRIIAHSSLKHREDSHVSGCLRCHAIHEIWPAAVDHSEECEVA